MRILIAIIGLIFLVPSMQAQESTATPDSGDTSAAQAAIKKLKSSAGTSDSSGVTSKKLTPGTPHADSLPSCDLNWSPWWNQLAPERQATLRQPGAVDRMIDMGGGLQAIPADERRRSEESDALAFQEDQAQGLVPPGMTSQEYTAFRRGVIDLYHCRTGDRRATKTPVPGLTSCQQAVYYRDHDLVKEFDAAMARYNVFRDGKLEQDKIRIESLKLMDKEWWGGKTGAQAAIEIKFYANLFNDTVGWIAPEEYFDRLYGHTANEGLHLVEHDAIAVDAMKKETDEGAKEAAKETFKQYAKEITGQVGSFVGIYDDLKAHNGDGAKLAQAQLTVQRVVKNIEQTISQYDAKMQESHAKMQSIADVVALIDQACAPAPVTIPRR
jgi:hypothetical protein